MENYQQRVVKHYNDHVRLRSFQVGQRVLHKVFQNTKGLGAGKFAPIRESPYEVRNVVGSGANKVRTMEGRDISHPWNLVNLELYHF